MLGAHFDSHAGATGATDNATGIAAMMEAMRILKALGVEAAPHDPHRALGRRRAGAARLARLRARAFRRSGDDGAEAGAREALGVLQHRQRHGEDPRHLDAGQSGRRGRSSSSGSTPLEGSRRRRSSARASSPRPITSSFDNVGLPGVPVRAGAPRIQLAHAPLEHGHLRSRAARRHGAAGDGAAVFAYNAAMRDEKLPRKALPKPAPERGAVPSRRASAARSGRGGPRARLPSCSADLQVGHPLVAAEGQRYLPVLA